MWNRLKKLFQKADPLLLQQEAYANGRATAVVEITMAEDKSKRADDLYYLADGAFNVSPVERAYDKGVCDQLEQMGYNHPYSNGHF